MQYLLQHRASRSMKRNYIFVLCALLECRACMLSTCAFKLKHLPLPWLLLPSHWQLTACIRQSCCKKCWLCILLPANLSQWHSVLKRALLGTCNKAAPARNRLFHVRNVAPARKPRISRKKCRTFELGRETYEFQTEKTLEPLYFRREILHACYHKHDERSAHTHVLHAGKSHESMCFRGDIHFGTCWALRKPSPLFYGDNAHKAFCFTTEMLIDHWVFHLKQKETTTISAWNRGKRCYWFVNTMIQSSSAVVKTIISEQKTT